MMIPLRKLKRYYNVCLLFSVGFIVMFLLFVSPDQPYSMTPNVKQPDTIQTFPNVHFKKKPVKKIIKWTGWFQKPDKNDVKCLERCEVACEMETDKAKIQDVDAVFFHLSDLWTKHWSIGTKSVIKFPDYRSPDQVWMLTNMEPPPHLWGNTDVLNGLFNWTLWYRHDADVLWPYGRVYKLSEMEQKRATEKLKSRNFFKEKSKEMTSLISNCFDPGQRYRIVSKLAKLFPIDGYGKCYSNQCDDKCFNDLKNYKFYLALENSNCRDYITEKYWGAIQREQIPIVNWKWFDKTKVLPNSYINLYDFDSIELFIDYLKKVSSNETLYNSYFEHRKFYETHTQRSSCTMCDVCKALHDQSRPAQTYVNMAAWIADDVCEKVGLWNNFLKNFFGWRFYLLGI